MQELVDTLAQQLPENSVRLNSAVEKLLEDNTTRRWRLELKTGEPRPADAVIIATPAFQTSAILKTAARDAAEEMSRISYASTATVSLAYRREDCPHLPKSFGFVVPAIEKRKIMACTFSSLKYPGRAPESHVLLRAFIGGSLQPQLFKQDDAAMEDDVRNELAKLLGVTAAPLLSRLWRHPNSMPQYHIGHIERVKKIENLLARFPSVALAGSAYHGVGISDCVSTGEKAAERLVSYFAASQ
jgi:oxygen-dependent protoporphyrinogen oxidase